MPYIAKILWLILNIGHIIANFVETHERDFVKR